MEGRKKEERRNKKKKKMKREKKKGALKNPLVCTKESLSFPLGGSVV